MDPRNARVWLFSPTRPLVYQVLIIVVVVIYSTVVIVDFQLTWKSKIFVERSRDVRLDLLRDLPWHVNTHPHNRTRNSFYEGTVAMKDPMFRVVSNSQETQDDYLERNDDNWNENGSSQPRIPYEEYGDRLKMMPHAEVSWQNNALREEMPLIANNYGLDKVDNEDRSPYFTRIAVNLLEMKQRERDKMSARAGPGNFVSTTTEKQEYIYNPAYLNLPPLTPDAQGYLVPNIVHFVRFWQPHLTFVEMLAIKAALVNITPDVLYIHSNKGPLGVYWDMIKNATAIRVKYMPRPKKVYGRRISNVHHSSDVARLLVLMKHGGIYIDNDMFVLKPLDKYRKYEFTVGWKQGESMGNQLLISNKNARFLHLYFTSYAEYNGSKWYYNGGELPTYKILRRFPWLVHRVRESFGVTNLCYKIFNGPFNWRAFDAVHLLYNHRYYLTPDDPIEQHDEDSIKTLQTPFGEMARKILYGHEAVVTPDGASSGD